MSKNTNKVKTLANLEANECRWPIGDPRHQDFHFCGAPATAGKPYCQHHWEQSFISAKQREQQQKAAQGRPILPAPLARRAA